MNKRKKEKPNSITGNSGTNSEEILNKNTRSGKLSLNENIETKEKEPKKLVEKRSLDRP